MVKFGFMIFSVFLFLIILKNLPILTKLLVWKFIDFFKFWKSVFKKTRKVHLFGIQLYVGLYGQGKTMGLTERLDGLRRKYGDKIIIATNYYYKGEDFHISHWKDLVKEYDKPVVFGYDEIQNDFNSRDYQNFPMDLLTLLTQNRKGHGKMVLGTAQRYNRVDKVFRELCQSVFVCKTRFGRLTSVKEYDQEDYEMMINTPDVGKKMKVKKSSRYTFVQSDKLRNMYDSYQMLESAKSKDYISRTESMQLL